MIHNLPFTKNQKLKKQHTNTPKKEKPAFLADAGFLLLQTPLLRLITREEVDFASIDTTPVM